MSHNIELRPSIKDTPNHIYPLRDLVLIKVDDAAQKTASGLLVSQEWKSLPPTGVVVAIGPEVKGRDFVGVRVVFERYASVVLDGGYRLCKESHLLAVSTDGYDPTVYKV
jgi:co-chaperonin GroES (HSP10)